MRHRVYFTSLGCAKNLIDSEQMLCLLDDAGYELEADPESAAFEISRPSLCAHNELERITS